MQEKTLRVRGLFLTAIMLTVSFAGCLEAIDSATKPRATLEAYPLLIQEGEMVTFDARESDAIEGIITAYRWDFGDGETSETVTGFTSHVYDIFGAYTVSLEVENDQGGIDEAFTIIIVNGVPTIELTYPENPRAGDAVLLDASASTDPESAELSYQWDLDWSVDSDGDGFGDNPNGKNADECPEVVGVAEENGCEEVVKESSGSILKYGGIAVGIFLVLILVGLLVMRFIETKDDEKDWNEGHMLFFPSDLFHAVYPHFLTDDKRISVSGDIAINSKAVGVVYNDSMPLGEGNSQEFIKSFEIEGTI